MNLRLLFLLFLVCCSVTDDEYNGTLVLINQYRSSFGVSLLSWSEELAEISTLHSSYMSRTGVFSHSWADGTSITDRARMLGYEYRGIGENIAKGNHTVKSVLDSWMRSEGHRGNILEPRFKNVGMSNVGDYWVMVLSD